MKINGSSKIGVWKYTEDAEYEPGDFIIIGRKIFYCERESKGNNPETSDNYFTSYPGNMIKNKEEYYEIAKNLENAEDKYISSKVLSEILQDSFFGLGNSGIIESKVDVSGSEEIATGLSSKLSGTNSAVDEIMTSPELNNGVVLLSRDLPEIKPYIGTYAETQETGKSCIYCDRDRCIKCWKCVKINSAERIRKTKFDDLVINNSGARSSDWTDSISECPTAALIRAYQDDVKIEEEQRLWNSVQSVPEKPKSDIIIYGAETWNLPYVKPEITEQSYSYTSSPITDFFLAIKSDAEIDYNKFSAQGIWQYFKDMAVEIIPTAPESERVKLFNSGTYSLYEISKSISTTVSACTNKSVSPDKSMGDNKVITSQTETVTLNPNYESYIPIIQDTERSYWSVSYINAIKSNNTLLDKIKTYLSDNLGIPSQSIVLVERETITKYQGTQEVVSWPQGARSHSVDDVLNYVEEIWQRAQSSNLLTAEEKKNIIQVSNDSIFVPHSGVSDEYAESWTYQLLYNYIVFDNACPDQHSVLSKYNIDAGFSLSWGDAIDNWNYPDGVTGLGNTRNDKIAYISSRDSSDDITKATSRITWVYVTRHFLTDNGRPQPDSFIVSLPAATNGGTLNISPLFYKRGYCNENSDGLIQEDNIGIKVVRGASGVDSFFDRIKIFDVNASSNIVETYDRYRFTVRQVLWLSNLIDCIKIDSDICNKLGGEGASDNILNTLINDKGAYATKRIDLITNKNTAIWYDISNFGGLVPVGTTNNRISLTTDQMFSSLREKFTEPLISVPSLYGQRDLVEESLREFAENPQAHGYIARGLTTNEWLDILKSISKEEMDSVKYSFTKTNDSITFKDSGDVMSYSLEDMQREIDDYCDGTEISLSDLLNEYSTGTRSVSKLNSNVYNATLYTVSLKSTSVVENTISGELTLLKEVARRKTERIYASATMWSGKYWYDEVFGEEGSLISNDVVYDPRYRAVSIIQPSNFVLLRQYTYRQTENDQLYLYRIQELVDPDYGYIWFRTSYSTDGGNQFSSVSGWKEVAAGLGELNKKLSELANYHHRSSSSNREYYYKSICPSGTSTSIIYPEDGIVSAQSNFANIIIKDLESNKLYSCILDINEIRSSLTTVYINDNISVEGALVGDVIQIKVKYQNEENINKAIIKELQYRVYNN